MLINILCALITLYGIFSFCENILNRKNYKLKLLSVIICCILTLFTYYFISINLIRLFFNWITTVFIIKILYKENIINSSVISFFVYLLIFIFEILGTFIFIFIFNYDMEKIIILNEIDLFINIFISFLLIISSKVKIFKSIFENIRSINYNKINILLLILVSFITTCVLSYYLYFDSSFIVTITSSLFLIIMYNIYVFRLLFSKKKIEILKVENIEMLENLRTYEEMLSSEKMKNHESKNNLLCIKGIIGDDSKKVSEYIDALLKEKNVANKRIKEITANLPSGGLRGLIYQKILLMKQNKIKYIIDISREIHVDDFEKINTKILCDIYKIVGIFVDNSIEETIKHKQKEVKISLYKENNDFIISVTNIYSGKLELDKMYKKGYSTKGDGRGHGLSIVNNIINNNKNLVNLKQINANYFTQMLKIVEYKK